MLKDKAALSETLTPRNMPMVDAVLERLSCGSQCVSELNVELEGRILQTANATFCSDPEGQRWFVQQLGGALPAWVVVVIIVLSLLVVLVGYRWWMQKKKRKREIAEAEKDMEAELRAQAKRLEEEAEQAMEKALNDQKRALEAKKLTLQYPKEWEMDGSKQETKRTSSGQTEVVQVPQEGLIVVPQTDPEYWDVHDLLRREPNPDFARQDPKTGVVR